MSDFAPPITKRLLKGAPGVNLTNVDVFNLLAMCPFESVAKEALSPFCSMFTEDDFRAFEYTGDLEKYYRTGYVSLCFCFFASGQVCSSRAPTDTESHWGPSKAWAT